MASDQIPAVLVARFLKAHHYTKTLESFLQETNLSEKYATTNPGDWTLEKLVEEKIQFDTSLNFERQSTGTSKQWTSPAPSVAHSPDLDNNTNVLCIRGHPTHNLLSISTADNTCTLVDGSPPYAPLPNRAFRSDGPIISTLFTDDDQLASTTMSGKLLLHDVNTATPLSEARHHTKWAVTSAYHFDPGTSTRLLATAGWDQKVHVYLLPPPPPQSHNPTPSPNQSTPSPSQQTLNLSFSSRTQIPSNST